VDHAMTRITTEGSRMQRLVEDLLLLARLDEGRPLHLEDVDLCGVAAESVGVARAVDRERAFEIAPGCSPITVRADASALRQVVDNLLGNVTAHTPAGTSAVVAVDQDGRHAMLSVSDDGPGLPTDGFGRAFDRFWRAEQSRIRPGGSGLGLAIVRELVAAHGGTVTAGASPRGGLSVEVSLPLAPAPPPARGA